MNKIAEIESRISELEKELGLALFPVTRGDRSADNWLDHLLRVKRLKDENDPVWNKMCNWD